jgi:hypothetical protein
LIPAVRFLLLACAAVCAAAQSHAAEPVVRIKARLVAFDGAVMRLETLPLRGAKGGDSLSAEVTAQTRYVGSSRASFATIKAGDYVGAAVSEQRGGVLRAQEVFLYAAALRGSGEGRFPEGERIIVNGTVTAVKPSSAEDRQDGSFTLHYRGALLTGQGQGRTTCEGRAAPPAYASALACQADVTIEVRSGTPVSALLPGAKDLLVPGAVVTVAMTKQGDKNVSLGVVVEPPPPSRNGVEKPQSSP